MMVASLPFVRYIQLVAGTARPLFRDTQVHTYLAIVFVVSLVLSLFQVFEVMIDQMKEEAGLKAPGIPEAVAPAEAVEEEVLPEAEAAAAEAAAAPVAAPEDLPK